ncbi:AI-2E family transporter [Roseomonas gilardii]|uniref:AI-2E family transporter n=1 Tax=Roseomonas gilardii TaxID=257708 RepID=UPI0004B71D3D|nr:AI-2E family transporter [Roseomonas gilardii]
MPDPSPATSAPSLAPGSMPGIPVPSPTGQGARQTPPPAQVPPPYSPDLKHLLTIVVTVVVISALYLAREVLIPITLAILLSFVVAPVVGLLRRLGLWRTPAVLVAVLLAMSVILVLGSIIGLQIAGLAQDLPRYQATIQQKVDTVQGTALGWVNDFVRQIDHAQPTAPPAATPGEGPRPLPVEIQQGPPSPMELAQRLLSPVLGPLETVFIVFIVAIFMLMQQADLRDRLIRLFGSDDLHRTTVALDDAAKRLSKYFLAQLAINGCFGAVVAAGLFFIGVPSPLLWGILAALFRFIPYVGALLAAALPIALAAGVDPGWNMVIWTAALFLVTEPIIGQVVEPMVYGHSTGLSPVSVIVAAIFWTWLWGPIGLILATPLTLCLVVLGRHVERLEFLDVMLGDRPALTPAENFYQRMLAGDADEAQAQAESLLEDRPLSSYYDEVALKGLRLAANDAQRGVLSEGKLQQIRDTTGLLVQSLAEQEDRDPPPTEERSAVEEQSVAEKALPRRAAPAVPLPPRDSWPEAWRGEGAVLCLPGRGPLDEAASTMLVQILGRHGLGARLLPHEAVSRTAIGRQDFSGVAMICLSYLDISGSPAHLRYLLRRLRQKAPGAPIVVGLWDAQDEVLRDAALRGTIGAEHYTTSLAETVTACLETVRAASHAPDMAPAAE